MNVKPLTLLLCRGLALLTALVIAGGFIFHAFDLIQNQPAAARYGLSFVKTGQGAIEATSVPIAAILGGVLPGSRVIAIGSVPVPEKITVFDLERRLASTDSTTSLTFETAEGRHVSVRLSQQTGVWAARGDSGLPRWLASVLSFVSLEVPPIVLLWAALLLLIKKPNDFEAKALAICFLMLCFSMENWITEFGAPVWLATFIYRSGLCCAVAVIGAFPSGNFALRGSWIPAAIASVGLALNLLYASRTDPLAATMQVWVSILVLLGLIATALTITIRFTRQPGVIERQQIKWVAIGAAVTALALIWVAASSSVGINLWLPGGASFVLMRFTSMIFPIGLPLGLLVAMLRYRLYDSDSIITHSATFAVLAASLLAIFGAFQSVITGMEQTLIAGQLGAIPAAVAAALTALLFAPVQERAKQFSERRCRPKLFHLREEFPVLVGDLRETCTPVELARAVENDIRAALHARAVAIVVDGKLLFVEGVENDFVTAWFEQFRPTIAAKLQIVRSDPVFPFRLPLAADGFQMHGWLLLGPRPDGSLYGREERKALRALAAPLARAMAISLRREDLHAVSQQERMNLSDRIMKVENVIGQFPSVKKI